MTLTGLPSGQKCSYSVRHRLRQCEIFAEVLTTDSDLQVNCEAGQKTIHLRTSQPELFRGKKVLLTLSKDNEVVWITDWMRFHRDAQGADALLLYDNASEKYSLNQLMEEMLQVGGFETIVIVKWPAPYGPQSFKGKYWDSNFCQDGVFEDARWRYLSEAHSVLNCDVDELVVSRNGSIFDLAASADTGYLSFNGRWALSVSDGGVSLGNPGISLRHRDITYQLLPNWRLARFRLSDATLCPPKWVVVPKRCPEEAQWTVHDIRGMSPISGKPQSVIYRHFRQINTNWKYQRAIPELYSPKRHRVDLELRDAFRRVNWST